MFFTFLLISGNINEIINQNNITENKILLQDCTFFHFKSSSNGGSIYIDVNYCILLSIFSSSFYNITSGFNSDFFGGIFYFKSTSGNLCISKMCGSAINALRGTFFYSDVVNNDNSYHNFSLISQISSCPDWSNPYNEYSLLTYQGTVNYNNLNSSNNHVSHVCSLIIWSPYNSMVKFSQFSNNPADILLAAVYTSFTSPWSHCNIINNPKHSLSHGLVHSNHCSPSLLIDNFIFSNNSHILLHEFSSKITCNNCSFDFYSSIGNPILINCSTNIFVTPYSFTYLNTFYCSNFNLFSSNRSLFRFFNYFLIYLFI